MNKLNGSDLRILAIDVEAITDKMTFCNNLESIENMSESDELLAWKFWQAQALLQQANALLNQLAIESKGK